MNENKRNPGRALLTVSSIIMLILALPLAWWTMNMAYSASPYDLPGDGLATWGCFIGAITYLWSIPVAVCGLIFRKKPHRYGVCRALGIITAVLLLACAVMQRVYFLFTTLPLAVLTALYLIAVTAPARAARKDAKQ